MNTTETRVTIATSSAMAVAALIALLLGPDRPAPKGRRAG